MKWSEVRTLHPNKFVLLEKLKEHIDGNYKYIDEVALIDVIDNDKEASDLLVRCKGDRFVYHTSDRKSTRLNSSHGDESRMPSSA